MELNLVSFHMKIKEKRATINLSEIEGTFNHAMTEKALHYHYS